MNLRVFVGQDRASVTASFIDEMQGKQVHETREYEVHGAELSRAAQGDLDPDIRSFEATGRRPGPIFVITALYR